MRLELEIANAELKVLHLRRQLSATANHEREDLTLGHNLGREGPKNTSLIFPSSEIAEPSTQDMDLTQNALMGPPTASENIHLGGQRTLNTQFINTNDQQGVISGDKELSMASLTSHDFTDKTSVTQRVIYDLLMEPKFSQEYRCE